MTVLPLGRGRYLVGDAAGRSRLAHAVADGSRTWVFLDARVFVVEETAPGPHRQARPFEDQSALSAPMPATVASIRVAPGDAVTRGDVLITLEAMKMELPVSAPRDGTVASIACRVGDLVQPGVPLLELD
jgi:biotin carboxyl carrier protein